MMMETSVFGREYLTVEEMYRHGEIGAVTLYSGFQVQNLDGYPPYWQGYPPMHYLTHALPPALALLDTTVESVQCQGAGRLTADRAGDYSNPFPTEVGLFRLAGSDALAVITMSFFQTARSYLEGFSLYGEHGGIEWPPDNEGDLLRFDMSPPAPGTRGNAVESNRMPPRDFPELLPSALRRFTRAGTVQLAGMPAPAKVGAHHGGSHPHLVAEFIASIREGRPPRVDVNRAAEWTAPGICAHQSALSEGRTVHIPSYAEPPIPPPLELSTSASGREPQGG
jgi:predicted dehydrogenase